MLFYTHGGAFRIGDKCDLNALPYLRALEHGYALVSVNCRLSGEAIFPAGQQDDFLKMDVHLAESGLGPCDHGEPESPESRYLGATIADVPELDLLEGAGHGDPAFETEENLNRVFALVDRYLK